MMTPLNWCLDSRAAIPCVSCHPHNPLGAEPPNQRVLIEEHSFGLFGRGECQQGKEYANVVNFDLNLHTQNAENPVDN